MAQNIKDMMNALATEIDQKNGSAGRNLPLNEHFSK